MTLSPNFSALENNHVIPASNGTGAANQTTESAHECIENFVGHCISTVQVSHVNLVRPFPVCSKWVKGLTIKVQVKQGELTKAHTVLPEFRTYLDSE